MNLRARLACALLLLAGLSGSVEFIVAAAVAFLWSTIPPTTTRY